MAEPAWSHAAQKEALDLDAAICRARPGPHGLAPRRQLSVFSDGHSTSKLHAIFFHCLHGAVNRAATSSTPVPPSPFLAAVSWAIMSSTV